MSKIRKSGRYRQRTSFQTATIIYDATYWFCEAFLNQRSRTVDQMVQAARSGRQNIAEGCRVAATSSQTELRLVNVARASLEGLLSARSVGANEFDRSNLRLPSVREADGPKNREAGKQRGSAVLGLHGLSRLHGDSPRMTAFSFSRRAMNDAQS
jgi:four helix bundle protein